MKSQQKHFFRTLVGILLLLVVTSVILAVLAPQNRANAATSSYLNFQARLLTSSGSIVPDGTYNVEFKLYDDPGSSGSSQGSCSGDSNCKWTETRSGGNRVTVINGYLTVNLGSVTPFPALDWSQEMWLTMNIGGTSGSPVWDGEMNPRLQLTAIPYAFQAGQATRLSTSDSGNTTTVSLDTPTANRTVNFGNASGTVALNTTSSVTGISSFVQGGVSWGATAILGTADSQSLNIQTSGTNRLVISNVGSATYTGGTGGDALTVSNSSSTGNILVLKDNSTTVFTVADGGYTSITANGGSGVALSVDNGTSTGNVVTFADNGTAVVTVADGGATLFKNTANSTTAFQIQNQTGASLLTADTTNLRVGIGTNVPNNFFSASPVQYSTGTISQTASTTVVGSGTTFTSAMVGSQLVYADGTSDTITAFTDTTHVTVGVSRTHGSSNFSIYYPGLQVTSTGTAFIQGTSTTEFQVLNNAGSNVLTVDTNTAQVKLGASSTSTGTLVFNNSSNGNTTTLTVAAPSGNVIYNLPATTAGTYDLCTSTGNCLGGAGGGANVALSNLASVAINTSLLTGNGSVDLGSGGSPFRDLFISRNAQFGAKVTTLGDVVASYAATGTTATTSGTGTDTTTLVLTGGAFADNDVLFIDNSGQDYFTRIVSGGGTSTPTVSPAISFDNAVTVTKYTTQSIGATATDYTTQSQRYFQGYFLGGVVTGAGSTVYSDGNIKSSNNLKVSAGTITLDGDVQFKTTNSATALLLQNSSAVAILTGDTSNKKVQVGSSTTDANAVAFILDSYNNASDPSGTNGEMYYNTSTNTFRCYQNSGWTDCIGSGGSGANTALSNLNSVAINTSLLAGSTSIDLGSGASPFRDLYIGGSATNNFKFTGTASAARTITVPDATGTICLSTGNCAGVGGTGDILNNGQNGPITVGTNDNTTFVLETNNTPRLTITGSGGATFSGALTVSGLQTASAGLTISTGSTFTNASSTLLTAVSVSNLASGGNIPSGGSGSTGASTTVDVASSFIINQSTASQTITLPDPTVATAGRIVYVSNIGSQNFTMYGVVIAPNNTSSFYYNGTQWTSAGIDGSGTNYIQNQSSSDQTADFRVSGVGRANTKFTSPLYDSITGGVSIGTTTATGVTIGGTTNTTSVLLQGAASSTYTIGTANNTGGIVIGNSTVNNTISIGDAAGGSNTQTITIGTSSTASSTTNVTIGSTIAGTVALQGATTVTNRTSGSANTFVVSNSTSTGTIAIFKDNSTAVATIADGGAITLQNAADSAAALLVKNLNADALFTVNTTNSSVQVGSSSTDAVAILTVFDSYNNNTDPTGIAGAIYYNTNRNKFRCYQNGGWTDCITTGGGSGTKRITMIPEFEGAVLSPDGSNNSGTMTAGTGSSHNYYQWETDQTSTQDYDIVVKFQLPSDFNSSTEFKTSTWKAYAYVDSNTDAVMTLTLADASATTCISAESIEPGSTGAWAQKTLSTNPNTLCTFAANDIVTMTIHVESKSPSSNKVRVGEIQYDYDL